VSAAAFLDHLGTIAAEVCAADRLHVLPPAAPSEMVRLAAVYDLGLVGETGHTQNRCLALTNKQFTYFLAGIPAVMTDIPAHRVFTVDGRVGDAARLYPVDAPAGLADALDMLLDDPEALASARTAAWKLGQERFNWDVEQENLLGCVSAAFETGLHARGTKRLGVPQARTGAP
jgi:glycosyltransferase involved in cell wall biosynthesis